MRLQFDMDRPIYLQIIDEFKRALARGELSPGERIPSQRELAQQVRVNPNTVQRAYREMEQIGLIETARGQGSFVGRDPKMLRQIRTEMAQRAANRFVQEMRALGLSDQEMMQWLQAELSAPGPAAGSTESGVTEQRAEGDTGEGS